MVRKRIWAVWFARKCSLLLLVLSLIWIISRMTYLKTIRHLHQEVTILGEIGRPSLLNQTTEETHKNVINLSTRKTLHYFPGLDLYIYTAFLDDRFNENVIRIFGLLKKNAPLPNFKCKWRSPTGENSDLLAKNALVDDSWPSWSDYFACYYTCNLTKSSYPAEIQLVSVDGKYVFLIPVEQPVHPQHRKQLALCAKPVSGSMNTAHLIEWFELQRASGIKDILLYTTVSEGTSAFVIQYYKDAGLVKSIPFPYLAAALQLLDKSLSEDNRFALVQQVYLITLQDCLYRFYGSYENLLLLDVNEVMLPSLSYQDLGEMVTYLRKYHTGHAAGFLLKNAWHFDDFGLSNELYIPNNMYMVRVTKATKPTLVEPKAIVMTDRAVSLNFHSVVEPRNGNRIISDADGYIHRFRSRCSLKFDRDKCGEFQRTPQDDPVFPFFRMAVVQNTIDVQKKLGLK